MARSEIAFHEMMGVLGVGDLHPAGRFATEFLLGELAKARPERVLEVGAGAGRTTGRMLSRGWKVTPIEPSAVLAGSLAKKHRVAAHCCTFESFDEALGPFDAVIGEGAFYRLEPKATVAKLHRLLKPGGLLALVDMMWTDKAKPEVVAFIHDQTKNLFGIPMAPREVVTASTWAAELAEGGFAEVATKTIEGSEFDAEPGVRRRELAFGLMKRPDMIAPFLKYRAYRDVHFSPDGWTENWMAVWRRSAEPRRQSSAAQPPPR